MDYTFTCERFDIRRTLFCGQAFRWKELDGRFCGIAGGRYAEISDNGDSTYTVHCIEKSDISYWQSYFDLDTDYDKTVLRGRAYAPCLQGKSGHKGTQARAV